MFNTRWTGSEWQIDYSRFELPLPVEIRTKKNLGTMELQYDKWIKSNLWWIEGAFKDTMFSDVKRGTLLTDLYISINDEEKVVKRVIQESSLRLEIERVEISEDTARKILRMGGWSNRFEYFGRLSVSSNNELKFGECKVFYKNNLSNIMMLEI